MSDTFKLYVTRAEIRDTLTKRVEQHVAKSLAARAKAEELRGKLSDKGADLVTALGDAAAKALGIGASTLGEIAPMQAFGGARQALAHQVENYVQSLESEAQAHEGVAKRLSFYADHLPPGDGAPIALDVAEVQILELVEEPEGQPFQGYYQRPRYGLGA